jgi:hypothetical protein
MIMLVKQQISLTKMIIALSLLAACNSPQITQTITPSPSAIPTITPTLFPVVQFLPAEQPWGDWQAKDDGFTLHCGIYAFNKDIVFLLGNLGVSTGTAQSSLLRSTDGGQHWVEVMKAIPGNNLLGLELTDKGTGWALVMWTVEGPGEITLFHTVDYGENWQEWSKVPKRDWYGYPIRMSFSDEKHGQIDIVYDEGLPDTNRIAYLTTSDSGLTWEESGSLPLNVFKSANDDKGDFFDAVYSYIRKNSMNYSQSIGYDGSLWKVDNRGNPAQITISKRFETGDWIITSILPKKYKYSDGQVLIP